MVVFFNRWKAEKFERQTTYDCQTCRINNWIEKQNRVCFLENRLQTISFPVIKTIDEKGNDVKPFQPIQNGGHEFYEEEVSVDGIYDWLKFMEGLFPSMPSFEVLQTWLRPLCIESILDPVVYHYFSLEAATKEYGVEALFLRKDLFDYFESIRAASNQFENIQNFKRESELKNNAINSKNKR